MGWDRFTKRRYESMYIKLAFRRFVVSDDNIATQQEFDSDRAL